MSGNARSFLALSDLIDDVNVCPIEDTGGFRNFATASDKVREFYLEHHTRQTMDFNFRARAKFATRERISMGIWDAIELLDSLTDDSDPDTDLSQLEHALQTAEAIRRAGLPDWMQVVGLVHDLGKVMIVFGSEGQWDVVGDTFVLGCEYPKSIIYADLLQQNPDVGDAIYSTQYGIYRPACGIDNVILTWGHDQAKYLYEVLKNQSYLPSEALAMIRYHSFYPWHRDGAYQHLMNEEDVMTMKAVQSFNRFDLYSKHDIPCDITILRPYYQGLVSKYFPSKISW